ncbi:peroxiredoxin [Cognatiyoonia sp. IB215182]|uniref:peroxiredoxin n=1 Tax=Cognatiyoonia sp. IB215182 TaxID=3097353 RepID=UPI002A16646D|nr:peroxiredoxin [Cognatiyoonia sp. IB215182]MDX8353710.1 peroxiredoxin [Cognatiyoonia sp. IB215182]
MSLTEVDWSLIPSPSDDGKADHLEGMALPDITLMATTGPSVTLSQLNGIAVIYAYPMTGRPDQDLPDGWNDIPGARGCTPQSCAFRDHHSELSAHGVRHLFGISTQRSDYQREAAERLHLPFPLLSDADRQLGNALNLPGMEVAGQYLHKRLTMIAVDGVIKKVFYPVFPPDKDADNVIDWLRSYAA